MSATIPNWIKTEDILEEIAEIEQEYETLLSEKDKSTKKIRENWEDLSDNFDSLREELNETIDNHLTE